jgi:YidC/Oxa1 family membrane protein insertase
VSVLNPLYEAVAWVIMRIYGVVGGLAGPGSGLAWVLTIAVLVVLMRLILLPLFIKQMHATRKMAQLAPELAALRKKFKNDRQALNEETMKLYRQHGVNPLSGCLPLVAQLPLFFALFAVLRAISDWHPGLKTSYGLTRSVITSAQHAKIFGASIADKVLFTGSLHVPLVPNKVVILCAVAVSVATTFLTVRQSTKRGMNPQLTPDNPMAASQKYMTYIVPLFALTGLYWQFGLVMYWMMTNLWTLGQQYVLFKRFPSLTAAPVPTGAAASAAAAGSAPGKPASRAASPSAGKAPGQAHLGGGRVPPAGTPPHADGNSAGPALAGGRGARGAASPSGGRPREGPSGRRDGLPGKQPAPPGPGGALPAGRQAAAAAQAGEPSANGSGLLRRLARGRLEAEPQPEVPDVKLVRRQRVRQPRSKRTGRR